MLIKLKWYVKFSTVKQTVPESLTNEVYLALTDDYNHVISCRE